MSYEWFQTYVFELGYMSGGSGLGWSPAAIGDLTPIEAEQYLDMLAERREAEADAAKRK